MPAKKRKKNPKHPVLRHKPKPVSMISPAQPPPSTQPPSSRWTWLRIKRTDFLGLVFLAVGLGILIGHWLYHHSFDHFPTIIGTIIAFFGALLLAPAAVADALKVLGKTVIGWLPWAKKNGTAETKAKGGD